MLKDERLKYEPITPPQLKELSQLTVDPKESISIDPEIAKHFSQLKNSLLHFKKGQTDLRPLKVGVLLSGGPAAGGHNVIAGLFDGLQKLHTGSQLVGFLNGPSGLIDNKYQTLNGQQIASYRNQGGFNLLGTGRTKIETEEQFAKSRATIEAHQLDGLVIVGGDDSNTNAAHLAQYILTHNVKTTVVGVPKTIDGDLKNRWIEVSFGFDSAAKTYSEIISNTLQDALSQRKHYFFIKVMGRTASHLVLECALQTQPNLALISEEVQTEKWTLAQVVEHLVDLIVERSKAGKNFGGILIPEGIIEFIPLDQEALSSLPEFVQRQLSLERDPHGNLQVSQIETERLLIELVKEALKKRTDYKSTFSAQPLFCGYEGRSCLPSNFDCNYCYNLGLTAALLVQNKATGYMACLSNLNAHPSHWQPQGIPLLAMMELRKGKTVVHKELVNLQSAPFQTLKSHRQSWRLEDQYQVPGPIQFFGPTAITDQVTKTLKLENGN